MFGLMVVVVLDSEMWLSLLRLIMMVVEFVELLM